MRKWVGGAGNINRKSTANSKKQINAAINMFFEKPKSFLGMGFVNKVIGECWAGVNASTTA